MNNRLRSSVSVNVSIFGVGHALIDAACAVVIFSLPGMKALSPDVLFAIFGIFFFNLTMPVTLVAIANLLPRYAGFSLGLTTMAIFIGLIAAVTPLKKIVYARLWPISIIILCSAGILFIGLRLYNMSMKNPDCKVVETETTAIVEQL